jgi:hypothetical protein
MSVMKTVIAISLLLLLFSCDKDSTGPSDPGDYLPLSVGNLWSYSMSGYMKTATIRDSLLVTGTKLTVVTGLTSHQSGFDLYVLKDSTTMSVTMPDTTITNTEVSIDYICKTDTEYRIYDDTVTTEYEILLKLPVVLNDSWVPESDEPTVTRTVRSVTSSITVPAGSYSDCVYLRDTDTAKPGSYFDLYISRGDGAVEFTIQMVDSTYTTYMDFDLTSSVVK